MDLRVFLTVFVTVFIAELGDKTQLATFLYATDSGRSKLTVFFAASSALILTSALAVLAGHLLSEVLNSRVMRWVAGLGFMAVGLGFS